MLLRTRITLMAATGLLATVLGLLAAGFLREQLLQQRLADSGQAAQSAQWEGALAQQDRALDDLMDKLLAVPDFLPAVHAGQAERIARQLGADEASTHISVQPGDHLALAAVLTTGRAPLVWGQQPQGTLLSADTLERTSLGNAVNGLRILNTAQALVLSTRLLPGTGPAQVLVLARDAQAALADMAQDTGAAITLLDLHGRMLRSTDSALWQAAAQALPGRGVFLQELEIAGQHYRASGLPLQDLAGQRVGTLVMLTDHSAQAQANAFLQRLALGGTAALLLTVLLGLYAYLRHSLRPLEHSIAALQALAQGDASVHLPAGGDDEIGRIARTVVQFRRNALDLAQTRVLRERMRRRQERLLRHKLQELAQATHQPLEFAAVDSDEAQLRQLAGVMNQLSGRLIDQHQRLSGMVQELREALLTKDRLAGLEQELQIAAQVQLSILPRHPPRDPRLQLHCHITPAREVGGDFYDYFLIDPEHLGLVIADVSGKGVPAALFMTITRTLLKATAQFIAAPTECIAQLNNLLAAENEQMLFVTLFYGVLDLRTGTLQYVNAGHNPPYLLHTDGRLQALARTGGMAVAVSEDFPYRAAHITLPAGAQIFLFTDGVTEAFNPQGEEYGEARLNRCLQHALQAAARQPADIVQAVLADVHAFECGAPQADDITCMALRYGAQ